MSGSIYNYIDLITANLSNNVISFDEAKESLKGLIPSAKLDEFYEINNITVLGYFAKLFHTIDENFK